MAERVTYSEFAEKVIVFPGLTILEFYSDACIPCKRMSPVLAALENRYPQALYVAKVNAAYEKELVHQYGIQSTPTLLFLKNGEVVQRLCGVRKQEELVQIIESNL